MKRSVGLIVIGFTTLVFGAWMGTVYEYCGEEPVGSGVLVWTKCTCHGDSAWDYTNSNGYYGLDLFSGMNNGCNYVCLTADDGEHTGTAEAPGEYQYPPHEYVDIELGVYYNPDE